MECPAVHAAQQCFLNRNCSAAFVVGKNTLGQQAVSLIPFVKIWC